MKRFHTPLLRLLRLRQQTERMMRLQVARKRGEFDAAAKRLAAAQRAVAQRTSELESRLVRPGASLLVQQALLELHAGESAVQQRFDEQSTAAEQLSTTVGAYRVAQQEREKVERAVEQRRIEHRRDSVRAAAVELQEWAVRPKSSTNAADREGAGDA
ncbi:MAG: hypothetical protein AB7I48_01770 [Planctomycetaceae bacterium]